MSAGSWIRQQRDRPIADHERRTAMAAIVVLLAAVAVLFTLTQPASQASRAAQGFSRKATTSGGGVERHNLALTPEVEQTARRFLAGYLAYTYGQAPARRITDATGALIASLQTHPPRVPPAAHTRRPRVLSLHTTVAQTGEITLTAVVNDGGLINYQVGLLLTSEHGRLLVTGLDGA
jgi:hypothetical protein